MQLQEPLKATEEDSSKDNINTRIEAIKKEILKCIAFFSIDEQEGEDQLPIIDATVRRGTLVVSVFLTAFFLWSVLAPLDSAAIAQGYVAVEQGRKTIAHLEGGIVGKLLIREDDHVEAGQVLIRLSDTSANATLELLLSRQMVARALVARLESEYTGLEAIRFPEDLNQKRNHRNVGEILQSQEQIFKTRRNSLENRKAILAQRKTQLQEEIVGLEGQISAASSQLTLLEEEIAIMAKMFKKGLADKPRLLSLQRRAHEVRGTRSKHKSDIARTHQSIGETELRIAEVDTSQISEVAEKLRTTTAELYDLNERLRAAEDVHTRTSIISPISGTVVGLQVRTEGGVIRPGEPLMDIVPSDDQLVVEARVAPNDIDIVSKGMKTKVRITAFSQRTALPRKGLVASISADHLVDESTGKPYYLARITLDKTSKNVEESEPLRPGMEAEVMIVTGERTFMTYMLEPLLRSFNRSFKET